MKLSNLIEAYLALRKLKDVDDLVGYFPPIRLHDGHTITPLPYLLNQVADSLTRAIKPHSPCIVCHGGKALIFSQVNQRYELVPLVDAAEIALPEAD